MLPVIIPILKSICITFFDQSAKVLSLYFYFLFSNFLPNFLFFFICSHILDILYGSVFLNKIFTNTQRLVFNTWSLIFPTMYTLLCIQLERCWSSQFFGSLQTSPLNCKPSYSLSIYILISITINSWHLLE